MLRYKELGLTLDEIDELDMGLITDMLIEKSNDDYEYPIIAGQEEFNKF